MKPTGIKLSRRLFAGSLSGLASMACSWAERDDAVSLRVANLNHMVLQVRDLDRSLAWYRDLLGLSLLSHGQDEAILRIGAGTEFLTLRANPDGVAGIQRIGMGLAPFVATEVLSRIKAHDFENVAARISRLSHDPNQPAADTPTILLSDNEGIRLQLLPSQLQLAKDNRPRSQQPTKPKPLGLQAKGYNHFTIFVSDSVRTVALYRKLFGMSIDTYQGPMPLLRVGDGNQFLAFVGAGGRREFRPFIHHACFTVESFNPDRVLAVLDDFGIKPTQPKRGPVGPLRSYVTMRMPDRGGAPGGTPELYLSDPDGILLQIQDIHYSGGSGYLGDVRGSRKDAQQ